MNALIERLRDELVTGFNLTFAACEAASALEAQQAEIDRLTPIALGYTQLDVISRERDALAEQVKVLRGALGELFRTAPGTVECNNMHHPKKYQHAYDETCLLVSEYYEALEQSRKALATGDGK